MQDTNQPLVTVVIPTFGRADHIRRAIDSVLEQTYPAVEIVVVDDNDPGSHARDETISALERYTADDRIRLIIRTSNGGGSAARNTGIDAARGDLVTFLDDDDFYNPTKIERQVHHILSDKLDISLCNMSIMDKGKYLDEPICYASGLTVADFISEGVAFTPMIMCRTSLIRDVGGFHITPRFQDHVLMIKLLETEPRIAILDQKLFVHNRHSGTRITFDANIEDAYSIRHAFEKRNVSLLTEDQRRRVLLRHCLVESRLRERRSGKLAGVRDLAAAVRYVHSPKDALSVLKTAGRLFIRPGTHF